MNCNAPILNLRVLRLHCENAAFLAAQLPFAQDSPAHRMVDLYDLEDRLSAHLEALALAGPVALDLALAQLAAADDAARMGEVHVAAALALRLSPEADLARLLPGIDLTATEAETVGAAASACPPEVVAPRIRRWLDGADSGACVAALTACRLRRVDPGAALLPLLSHRAPEVAALAASLAGELGRADLLPRLLTLIRPEDAGFAAARAAALLGDRGAAPAALRTTLRPGCPADLARQAAELLPLVLPASESRALLSDLARDPDTRRWSLVACAALGAVETLEGLIALASDPPSARLAGAAFCQITGARLGAENLELAVFPDDPEPESDDPLERFIDSHLYWPDPDRLRDWLAPRKLPGGERLLLGRAAWTHAAPPDLPADLASRNQLELRALALEIACRRPDAPLPNHRAPVRLADRGFVRSW